MNVSTQTFGDYGRWHPHLHLLVPDGLFLPNGSFHVMPNLDLKPLQELFRAAVLKVLKKEGKIDDDFIRILMQWRHVSGFNIHNGVKLNRQDIETVVCEAFDDGWGRSGDPDGTLH